jgi:lysophospholipase L1-like esterase
LVLVLSGAVFLLLGIRSSPPVRAAVTTKIKIMPLGDSITSGTDASYSPAMASYRCELESLTGVTNYDYVGSVHGQWGNTGRPLLPVPSYCTTMADVDEEGHSGYAIANILAGASSWPGNLLSWATAADPDLVLIHLGTVDLVENGATVVNTVVGIGQVIDTLRAANPFVRILLAQIIPGSSGGVNGTETATIPQFNALLPALVASKARPSSPILLVDMHTNFYINQHTLDGVHPNPNGENKMAGRWKTAIDQIMAIEVTLYSTYIPKVSR